MTFASGWASGINAYATVLVLGLLGRFAGTGGVPEGFQRTDVLIVMGVLALIEVVADKVPVLDSFWDVPSTVIRPIAGAVIGALIAGARIRPTPVLTTRTPPSGSDSDCAGGPTPCPLGEARWSHMLRNISRGAAVCTGAAVGENETRSRNARGSLDL